MQFVESVLQGAVLPSHADSDLTLWISLGIPPRQKSVASTIQLTESRGYREASRGPAGPQGPTGLFQDSIITTAGIGALTSALVAGLAWIVNEKAHLTNSNLVFR